MVSLESVRAVDNNGWKPQYHIIIDTPFESLGKFYNMIIKELEDFGYFDLVRIEQSLSASPTSAFYTDVAARKAYAKQQFDKGMELINKLIQSIIRLVYSLREFDLILGNFDKLVNGDDMEQKRAELNFRRVFLDEVDSKRGRGSINGLATTQGLEYVGLRDAFLIAQPDKIEELNTNERVKRILKDRINDYLNWRKQYLKDIRGRHKIQKEYLRNQVESMKMQLNWVKPYYVLMQQLEIDTGVINPDLLAGIDTSIIKTKIRGFITNEKKGSLVTAFCDVDFMFKTSPMQIRGIHGQSFHHLFNIEIKYTPYVMSNSDYDTLVKEETFEDIDFLKTIAGESIDAIKDDLKKYMSGYSIKEKETVKEPGFFDFLIKPFTPLIKGFTTILNPASKNDYTYKLNNQMKELNNEIISRTADVYGNFKDENGYITWSASLD